MSTDKENPKNGDMEVEDASSEENPDTPESKSVTEAKDSEDSSGKAKEKDSIKKKAKGKDVKKEEASNDTKAEKEEKDDSESEEDDDDNEDDGKVPLLDQPLEMSGTRERKKVQRFTEEYKTEAKDKAPIEIPEGKGMALGSIGKIEANIQKMKADEIKPLHKFLFNRTGKAAFVKKYVRKFNGFDFDEKSEQYTKKKQVLLKLEMKVLKGICTILNLKKYSKREELVESVLSFLMKPEGSDQPVKQQKKRGSRTNKSYSESDEEKRPQPRRGKMKRASLKEVSTDEEEFDDQKDKGSDEENDKAAKKERKRKDSDKDAKENQEEDENAEEEEEEEDASSDDSEEPKSKRGKGGRSGKKNNKASAKKANSKKAAPKKVEKKPAPKKRAKSEDEDEDESSEDEPIIKKAKSPPTDEEIKTYVKHILEGANLEETTMKIVCRKVYAHYPDFDLAHKKDFIKTTVKSLIST